MINPFYNDEEKRSRSLIRLTVFFIIGMLLTFIPSLIPVTWIDYLFKFLLVVGFYRFSILFTDRRKWKEGGLVFNKVWFKDFLYGSGIAFVVMLLIFLTEYFTGGLRVIGYGWNVKISEFWALPVLIIFIQMISVGFYEEIILRGYILRNMHEGLQSGKTNNSISIIAAVVLSSSLFSVLHYLNPNATTLALINIFAAGVMLAIPFILSGSLGLSVGIHFSWNFFMSAVFGFNVSGLNVRNSVIRIEQLGPDVWTGGGFGPEGGLIGLAGIILVLGLTLLLIHRRTGQIVLEESFRLLFCEKKKLRTSSDELA
ncbi:lysostaphin resistance A-like protein [Balneola sp. MJW-20]|uniref:CPBP family intramembrane glutamic endopeptidase n=1 Tax=Gracilimonas aurantiaca TaxID=3234185 RepID=UPI0034651874